MRGTGFVAGDSWVGLVSGGDSPTLPLRGDETTRDCFRLLGSGGVGRERGLVYLSPWSPAYLGAQVSDLRESWFKFDPV